MAWIGIATTMRGNGVYVFLAPQIDETKDLLTQLVVSHTSLTSAAISAATTFIAPQESAPGWLGPLQTALTPLQESAQTWQTVTGPQVIENLPQALVSYNSRFQVAMQNAANGDQDRTLQDFQWLQRTAGDPLTTARALSAEVATYASDFAAQRGPIEAAIAAATKSIQQERDEMERLADLISALYQKISAQTADVSNDWTTQVTTGAGLSFTLLKWGFTAATTGVAEIPFLDIAVALASITYAAIETALTERDIVDELTQIGEYKLEMTIDAQRIASLQAIQDSLGQLDTALVAARDAPSFAPVWEDVQTDLGDAIEELSRPGFDMTTLAMQMTRAAAAWQQASDMATNVQTAAAGSGERWTIDLTTWKPAQTRQAIAGGVR